MRESREIGETSKSLGKSKLKVLNVIKNCFRGNEDRIQEKDGNSTRLKQEVIANKNEINHIIEGKGKSLEERVKNLPDDLQYKIVPAPARLKYA